MAEAQDVRGESVLGPREGLRHSYDPPMIRALLLPSLLPTLLPLLLALAVLPATPQKPTPAAAPRPVAAARAILVGLDGQEKAVALGDLDTADPRKQGAVIVRFEGAAALERVLPGDLAQVEVVGGEFLAGPIGAGKGEWFDVNVAGGIPVGVDLEQLVALRFPARLVGAAGVEPAPEGDRLFRAQQSGVVERIDGAVEEFSGVGVSFHGTLVGSLTIPWKEVAALFIENLGSTVTRRAEGGVPVVVDLDDQSRVAGTLEHLGPKEIRLKRGASVLALPVQRVLMLSVDDGSIAFLSGLRPSSAEPSRPFGDDLGMVWPPRFDRSVRGEPLVVAGVRHSRGIGVHAPSRIVWTLDGTQKTLRGAAAVDDEVQRLATRGSCIFRVHVDGKQAFASSTLRSGDAPAAFVVDLSGAKELVLEVDPTPDGFAGDRADWLGLVLERAAPPDGASKR